MPREAATGADVVVSSLANDEAVRQVTLESDGVIAGLAKGAVHVGTSTISVGLVDALVAAHQRAGTWSSPRRCWGARTPPRVASSWILAGGDDDALARAQPVLTALGQGQIRLGTPRQAMLGKITAGNSAIASTIEIIAEATTLGEKGGIAPAALVGMLTQTLFGSPKLKGYGARIAAREFEPAGFAMPLGLKDVELPSTPATSYASRCRPPPWCATTCWRPWRAAASAGAGPASPRWSASGGARRALEEPADLLHSDLPRNPLPRPRGEGEGSRGSLLGVDGDSVDGGGAADLVAGDQQRLARGAVRRRDEDATLRAERSASTSRVGSISGWRLLK